MVSKYYTLYQWLHGLVHCTGLTGKASYLHILRVQGFARWISCNQRKSPKYGKYLCFASRCKKQAPHFGASFHEIQHVPVSNTMIPGHQKNQQPCNPTKFCECPWIWLAFRSCNAFRPNSTSCPQCHCYGQQYYWKWFYCCYSSDELSSLCFICVGIITITTPLALGQLLLLVRCCGDDISSEGMAATW